MSTQIKTLKGSIEIKVEEAETISIKHLNRKIDLSSFYGGIERGKSLQIGFKNEFGHYVFIQLDNKNVLELLKELNNNFNQKV